METPEVIVPAAAPAPRPAPRQFQYQLRTLLLVMTGLAVLLSAIFAGPSWLACAAVLVVTHLLPLSATIALVYGQGLVRTFAIGALFPFGALLLFSFFSWYGALSNSFGANSDPSIPFIALITILVDAMAGLCCGLVAIGLRRLIERQPQPEPPSTDTC